MSETPSHFLREIVREDLRSGRHKSVVTRFPPEPNGYLHIGHAKAICLNFGLAKEFGGVCHLRMDDTNPLKEDPEYVAGIQRDIRWLGFEWGDKEFAASDYFPQLHAWAIDLIERGLAYVDHLSEEDIRSYRGTITEPGRPSPYRDRSVADNLDWFGKMYRGELEDGACVLRAKGDLESPNLKMRDPMMYRIRRVKHHAAGDWNIYPFYDYAHGLSDAIEGVTHSLCSLEFENNRELYDWFLEIVGTKNRPRQYEFARLNMGHCLMSKRRLLELVRQNIVSGWDDPRMPTLAGFRRRGVPAEAIRDFCERIGVARADNLVDSGVLDAAVRDALHPVSPRRMVVLRPLEVLVESWPEGQVDEVDAADWPPEMQREGSRKIPFQRTLLIEEDDFQAEPQKGFFRLSPGQEVRLRFAYVVRCTGVDRDAQGRVVRVRVTHDPGSRGGDTSDGRKVKGTIHWVPGDAPSATVRLFDHLFTSERPDAEEDWMATLNTESRIELQARVEPSLLAAAPGDRAQFERQGFFFADPVDSKPGGPVFHRTVALREGKGKTTAPGKEAGPEAPKGEVSSAKAAGGGKPKAALDRERAPEQQERFEALCAGGVGPEEADVLVTDAALDALFQDTVAAGAPTRDAARCVVQDLRPLQATGPWLVDGKGLAELIGYQSRGELTAALSRQVLSHMLAGNGSAGQIIAEKGLKVMSSDAELQPHIDAVLAESAGKVAEYRGGKVGLFGFFVGAVMRRTNGKADAKRVDALLREALK